MTLFRVSYGRWWRVISAVFSAVLFVQGSVASAQTERGTFSGAKETEMPDWFKESFLDFEEDIEEATANDKRLMLFFHQAGCPYCNALVEHNLAQVDIEQTVRNKLDVVVINIWGDLEVVQVGGQHYTEKTLAEALNVNYTPTLIFFNEEKKVALRLDGYYPPEQFRKALRYVVEKKDTELSYVDYMTSLSTIKASEDLHQEDFFLSPPFDLTRTKSASKPLAVFFEEPVCKECDVLHEKILADSMTREIVERLDNVQLNMTAETPVITPDGKSTTARQWALDLNVQFAPTIVFFHRQGKEVMRTEAMFKTFHTQSVFEYVLTESYKEQPNFQRYLSARADRLIEEGVDVNIWGYESGQEN